MSTTAKPGSSTEPWLDPDVEAFVRIYDAWKQTSGRLLKRLWREKGLTERRLFILAMVQRGESRPSHLIEALDVLPSTITFETDKLVKAGLITREALPSDRRVVRLLPTAEGVAVYREMVEVLNGYLRPRIAALAPGELAAYLRVGQAVIGWTLPAELNPDESGRFSEASPPRASRAGPKT